MSLLPAGYKRLEYIEATGTQYIKTGFKPTQNTRAHCAITCPPTGGNWMFGARKGGGDSQFGFVYSTGGYYLAAYNTVQTQFNKSMNSSDKIIVNANKNITTLFANGATASVTATVGTFTCPVELILFGCNTNGTISYGKGRVYLFELYEAGLLIRYYIPAKNPSGVVGLYDIANGVFYGNSGTGVFTAGPEIADVDDAFKQVEYIQSSGTQYVDTGFKPNNNSRIAMIAKYLTAPTANAALFGARNADNNEFWVYYRPADAKFCLRYASGGASDKLVAGTPTAKNVVDINKNTLYVGNASVSATAASYSSAYTAYLFAVNNANSATLQSAMQVYSTDIYDNGTQVREYVPHVTALGTPGLLDTVNNVFYSSVTAADFVAGPEIVEEYTELEWIESNGAQYADTGYYPNQNTRVVMDCESTKLTANGVFTFGSRASAGSVSFATAITATQVFADFYNGYKFVNYSNPYERILIDFNKNVATFTGSEVATISLTNGTFAATAPLLICNINQGGAPLSAEFMWGGKIYAFDIYENDIPERHYVPALLPDGRVGLVDTLANAFYESATATPFVAGDEKITIPVPPANLEVSVSDKTITLSWDASENAVGYDVYRNGEYVATTFDTTFTDTINPAIAYEYGVTAYNEYGKSEMSTVAVPATQVPERVADLRTMDAGFNYITLAWDNVAGADAYRVFRDGTLLSEQANVGYSDSGLKTETAYTYGVSAVNEVGESTVVEITVSTTEFKLVTDRTAADVQRVLDLSKTLTMENMEEWLAGMKGSYNVFDFNRVELAVLYVIERLRIAGWYITVESKTDWKFSDFPTVSEMTRYLNNIRKLRSALPKGLPSVPADMGGFTYNEANDIERLLEMLDAAVTNITANVFYSNELYSGEVM